MTNLVAPGQWSRDLARVIFLSAVLSGSPVLAETFDVSVTKAGNGSGTVSADSGTIACGATCTGAYSMGTALNLSAVPAIGDQFTGWLGPCTGTGDCQFTVQAATSVTATFAPSAIGPPSLDVDGNADCDALTDGLLVIRHLFGLSGTPLVTGAVAGNASRSTAEEIGSYFDDINPILDVDGNGKIDAPTDGLLILRYLFGLRGAPLVTGAVGGGATRDQDGTIGAQIQALCNPPMQFALTVSRSGTGFGLVSSAPAGIACGSSCSDTFTAGTMLTLSAAASNGSTFDGWSGACSGTGACIVTMDAAKSVSAAFTLSCTGNCFVSRYAADGSAPPSPLVAEVALSTQLQADLGVIIATNFGDQSVEPNLKNGLSAAFAALGGRVSNLAAGIAAHDDLPTVKYSACGGLGACPFGYTCGVDNWCHPNANIFGNCDYTSGFFTGSGVNANDDPYYQLSAITTDLGAAAAAANGLHVGDGEDLPSAAGLAVHHAVTGNAFSWPTLNGCPAGSRPAVADTATNFGALGFRKDALPILVAVAQNEFHNGYHATVAGSSRIPPTSSTCCFYSLGSATCSIITYAPEESYSFTLPTIADVGTAVQARGGKFIGASVDDSRAVRCGLTTYVSGPASGTSGTSAARNVNYLLSAYGDMAYLTDHTGSLVQPSVFTHGAACTAGQCCTGFNGAGVAADGPGGTCRLVFNANHDGSGIGTQIVTAVTALLDSVLYDVVVQAYNDASEVIDVVGNFISKVEPDPAGGTDPVSGGICTTFSAAQLADDFIGPQAVTVGVDGVNDTIKQINPTPLYCFALTAKPNNTIAATSSTQFYHAWLHVHAINPAGGTITLGPDRPLVFVIPPSGD